jgi:hypothetical protein
MAVSRSFPGKPAASCRNQRGREYAGKGHIADLHLCPTPRRFSQRARITAGSQDQNPRRKSHYTARTILTRPAPQVSLRRPDRAPETVCRARTNLPPRGPCEDEVL